jgi:uncharacterized cofD-like protein
VLPPGDIRKCLVALSNSSEILRELMNYRFQEGGLAGHSFGNLFLSALEKIKGNFSKGVEEAAKILNVKGEVIPVSEDDMKINIELNNGEILQGESHLDHNEKVRKFGVKRIFLVKAVRANKKALERIKQADFIIIGPGDHYGSLLPNFLIKEISNAIKKAKAKVIYNCKLTNKKGQTDGFDLDRYVQEINNYIGKDRIDFVTFNTTKPPEFLIKKYERKEGKGVIVEFNEKKKIKRNYKVIKADLLNKNSLKNRKTALIRHDSDKLAKILMMIMEIKDYQSLLKEII